MPRGQKVERRLSEEKYTDKLRERDFLVSGGREKKSTFSLNSNSDQKKKKNIKRRTYKTEWGIKQWIWVLLLFRTAACPRRGGNHSTEQKCCPSQSPVDILGMIKVPPCLELQPLWSRPPSAADCHCSLQQLFYSSLTPAWMAHNSRESPSKKKKKPAAEWACHASSIRSPVLFAGRIKHLLYAQQSGNVFRRAAAHGF